MVSVLRLLVLFACVSAGFSMGDGVPSEPVPFLFQASNSESIRMTSDTGSATTFVEFESTTGHDSTVLSTQAYSDDVELIVKIDLRLDDLDGYQPQLVLFLAPETTSMNDVNTDDDLWNVFEDAVVTMMKERIHSDINHTWFSFKTKQEDGSFLSGPNAELQGEKIFTGTSLKIQRVGGRVSSLYSLNYNHETGIGTWISIVPEMELPPQYQSAPLKVGYRIKRDRKSGYFISTSSKILSSHGPKIQSDIPYQVSRRVFLRGAQDTTA